MEKHEIQWITVRKTEGNEEKVLWKQLFIEKPLKQAIIRFQSDCVCGVFINDQFIISGTGHYPERVNCHEITHTLAVHRNTVRLVLGTRYYQSSGFRMRKRRGYWYSHVACEIELVYQDGEVCYVPSNSSWQAEVESGIRGKIIEAAGVTESDYNRLWRSAALWMEPGKRSVADAVLETVGDDYKTYFDSAENPNRIYPVSIWDTNMTSQELPEFDVPDTARTRKNGEDRYVVFDFGRLVVGFTEYDLEVSQETELIQIVEWKETPADFDGDYRTNPFMERLALTCHVKPGQGHTVSLYRRAFRYIKVLIPASAHRAELLHFSLRPCLYPVTQTGWFSCNDDRMNQIWEVGKYTLHVNKQQEYESCPRNEMKFFSGDGIIAALTDYYAFGDHALVDASLSLQFPAVCSGKVLNSEDASTNALWDYPGWWIVMLYNEYKYYGDGNILKKHYAQAVRNLEWYISRMNKRNLIYSFQKLSLPFCVECGGVEWTDDADRLGEKTSLNCMLYKTLCCMAELGEVLSDPRAEYWKGLSRKVRAAINRYLWSDEKNAYMDAEYDYIPQDGNALAVLFGVADEKRSKVALNTLRERLWSEYGSAICDIPLPFSRGGSDTIAPLMCTYEAEARFMTGDSTGALELIRRCWGSMIQKGARTFWEYAPNNPDQWSVRSHAWSAGCTYLLGAWVLGVRPAETGWKKMRFDPRPGNLDHCRGVVPTPYGQVAVRYELQNGQPKYVLALPRSMEVETAIPLCQIDFVRY